MTDRGTPYEYRPTVEQQNKRAADLMKPTASPRDKAASDMLAALIAAEPDLAAAAKQFGYTPSPLVAVRTAIAQAEAAGITVPK